jgi:hypothetical protein
MIVPMPACGAAPGNWRVRLMLDPPAPGMPRRDVDRGRGGRAMLVELSVAEQRYHAVMEVIVAPVIEVVGPVTPRPHRRWRAFSCFALR